MEGGRQTHWLTTGVLGVGLGRGRRGSGGSSSKRREEGAAVRQDTWLQLSRLYRALGEKVGLSL